MLETFISYSKTNFMYALLEVLEFRAMNITDYFKLILRNLLLGDVIVIHN
jgi:hypothetical protein